jgi:hypothetical protein
LNPLAQFTIGLSRCCELGPQALSGDLVARSRLGSRLSDAGIIDQCRKVFMPLQVVAMQAGACDDHPSRDSAVLALQFVDRSEDGCAFGRRVSMAGC